jgi:cytochrome c553
MNDENIGSTPPDKVYKGSQVAGMCGRCHDAEDHPKVPADVRALRLAASRKAQSEVKGRPTEPAGLCTDCHGRHWVPPKK